MSADRYCSLLDHVGLEQNLVYAESVHGRKATVSLKWNSPIEPDSNDFAMRNAVGMLKHHTHIE
jgi:hypothetical protein